MYSSYTTLQRAQLAKQEYLDTQEVFLGIYAPGRNAALKASLQDQLHRKFLLTDSLRPEALGSAAGVLLVREDLFLMSTALSCFADALRSGADYVTSDAVFGYSGVTTLYHSQGFAACPGCALVSRELLRRCQAEARDPENPVELLTLAAKLSRSHVCLPLALAHYERDICAEDVWSVKGKRVFIMSHLLDMTGAPIVLVSAVPVLRSMGYEVVVLGPEDGGSMPLFLEAGATVITRKGCVQSPLLWGLALCADLVLANTVVDGRRPRPERCAGAGALVAPRCLCRLPPHRPPDPQRAGRKYPALLRRQPRRQRHAFGAAGVQHPAPHLRPAGLRRREVLPLRFELCGRAASVRHRGLLREPERPGHLLQSHPAAAA